jgi:hypothetical protein
MQQGLDVFSGQACQVNRFPAQGFFRTLPELAGGVLLIFWNTQFSLPF